MLTDEAVSSSHVKETLNKLSALWRERATVNHGLVDHSSLSFQPQRADFPEALLPFRNHPRWKEAPDDIKAAALSYAWAIYNLKTVYVECDIVMPACEDLIKRPFGGAAARYELQQVMSEALLDEALHTKMSITACNYIYRHRKLVPLDYTKFNLVMWRERLLADCEAEGKRRLAKFAIAAASETLITDYLNTLAADTDIQPICREVTRSHAMDEWGHSRVFSVAAEHVVASLSESERRWFAGIVQRTVEMFADNELGAWAAALGMLSFPHREEMISDSMESDKINVYTNSVANLLEKLGLDVLHG
ncbi:diiron oxygenase [Paraburkholderia sp. 2C]|jgi:para-aminobenzoate N-oxygenase AurF